MAFSLISNKVRVWPAFARWVANTLFAFDRNAGRNQGFDIAVDRAQRNLYVFGNLLSAQKLTPTDKGLSVELDELT